MTKSPLFCKAFAQLLNTLSMVMFKYSTYNIVPVWHVKKKSKTKVRLYTRIVYEEGES